MTMNEPVTAPQVSPLPMPDPNTPATLNAISRSRPNRSPYVDSKACAQLKPCLKQAMVPSTELGTGSSTLRFLKNLIIVSDLQAVYPLEHF
jgi:hypothetical protein